MKIKMHTIVLIVLCVIGLSLLLYPTVSNYWNSRHATRVISHYAERVENMDREEFCEQWERAVAYNGELALRSNSFFLSDELKERYWSLLDVGGDGIMGYIEIEKLGVALPIYHGTDDAVLQNAIGHLEWSSLPVGGEGSHCVVSGHRGLPNRKLFTDLDELRAGDRFVFHVLGQILTYEVDRIATVLPAETEDLRSSAGKDYCTLVTCTPYGINTHRLLVRGHRVENDVKSVSVVAEAIEVDPFVVAPILAFPLLLALFLMVMLKKPERRISINEEVPIYEE